jgi:hypothetical protein
MKEEPDAKAAIITLVLSMELAMFQSVPGAQRASCQDQPETFKLHRRAQFSTWSLATLQSYLDDLESAQASGINLMTVKYARMQDLIPGRDANPLIDAILDQQCAWQMEMFSRYPCLMGGGRPLLKADDTAYMTSFETYLRGELETYSDRTLESLHGDMIRMRGKGVNMAKAIYDTLVRDLGYHSLDEAEAAACSRSAT